ncbi:MAG: hypothetical protein FJW35_05455 [Acidobacteria bacterium]|nr:hypothetical protein [Acidobacteriota bacterium]
MKHYAAFLKMKDPARSQDLRPQHLEFLEEKGREGKTFARGRFSDNTGGLVIYRAASFEEALAIAQSDPYVANGARTLELHEWDMKLSQP